MFTCVATGLLLFAPGACLAEAAGAAAPPHDTHGELPPLWLLLPFVALLLMIVSGPLFCHRFRERHYPKVSVVLGLVVALWYALAPHGFEALHHVLQDYFSFIALVGALFIVSGGIPITMIPAPELIERYADTHTAELSISRIYWINGLLSGVLDHA
jgi:Na+/H+ antiporter NhaD/arsenite permease-like protein